MLAGELPWERACDTDERYAAWSAWAATGAGAAPRGPWRKLSAPALALLRRALAPDAERRAALAALLELPWSSSAEAAERAWRSQPAAAAADVGDLSAADMDALICRSQPAHADDLLLATPNDAALAPLGRRMTRLWLRADEAAAMAALGDALRQRGYVWRRLHPRLMAIECGAELKMRAWATRCGAGEPGGARTLLEFRRSRGCGLQFKRRYVELREALAALQAPAPPHAELLHVPHYAT